MSLRTALVKAVVEQPKALVVDVDHLEVPAPSAWSVLTSVQWMTSEWPGVMICGVCTKPPVRAVLAHQGVSRYVPIFESKGAALHAATSGELLRGVRLRATRPLPRHAASAGMAREFIRRTLIKWSHPNYFNAASAIAGELIRNVLQHTMSAPRIRLELDGDMLTVAVADGSSRPAIRRESAYGTEALSGLGVVSALSKSWGCLATGDGKVVWAVIGSADGHIH
jgi:hypothetical protein